MEKELIKALMWFCHRVEIGEVKSEKTYSKFRELINKYKSISMSTNKEKSGIELIAQERKEQIQKHGFTAEYDSLKNKDFQLQEAASALANYAIPTIRRRFALMPDDWDDDIVLKMCKKPCKERLIIAGALIAAEIDRIQFNENKETNY